MCITSDYGDGNKAYRHPDGSVSSELPELPKPSVLLSETAKENPVKPIDWGAGFMPNLSGNPNAVPITRLDEMLAQETRNMGYGFQNVAGEAANEFTGSSNNYKKAMALYDDLEKAGKLKDFNGKSANDILNFFYLSPQNQEEKDYLDAYSKVEKPANFFDAAYRVAIKGEKPGGGLKMPDSLVKRNMLALVRTKEMEDNKYDEYKLLSEALKSDDPRAFLEKGAQQITWGDRQIEQAAIGLAKSRPGKGAGAWFGKVLPMAGTGLLTVATALNPYTRPLARPLAQVTMGAFAVSSAGEAMAQARNYAKANDIDVSDDEVHAVGALTGASMYLVGKIPVMKGVKLLTGTIGKNVSDKIAGEIVSNPAARAEAADFFKRAAKDIPGLKSFTAETAKKTGKDVLHGAGVGAGLAMANSLIPMIYENPEDYPALNEIATNALHGAADMAFVSLLTSGAASFVNSPSQNARRIKQGNIVLADAGKEGIVEILGQSEKNFTVLKKDGSTAEIPREQIKTDDVHTVSYKDFKAYADAGKNNLAEFENLTAGEKRIVAENFRAAAEEYRAAFGTDANEEGILNLSKEEQTEFLNGALADKNLTQRQKTAYVNYVMRGNAYKAMNEAHNSRIETATEGAIAKIRENINPDTGGITVIETNGKEYVTTQGRITLNEDGTIDKNNSDAEIYYKDENGDVRIVSIDKIERVTQSVPEKEALDRAERIASDPVVAELENDLTRPYEAGETVRTEDGMLGVIKSEGLNENGKYTVAVETPQGYVDMEIEPRQIVDEDNIRGMEQGDTASYLSDGKIVTGEVEDMHSLRNMGIIVIDGKEVPIADVIRKDAKTKIDELNQKSSEIDESIQSGVLSEEQKNYLLEEKDKITRETERLEIEREETETETPKEEITPERLPAPPEETKTAPEVIDFTADNSIDKIPKDTKGNLLFEQAPAETTLSALHEIYDDESEVRSTVEAVIDSKQKELEKAAKYRPTGDIQKDIANKRKSREAAARIQKELDYWNGVLSSMPQTGESVVKQSTGKDVLPKGEAKKESAHDIVFNEKETAEPVKKLKPNHVPGGFNKELLSGFDYDSLDLRGKILYDIASGNIGFHVGDKTANGEATAYGIKRELGYGKKDFSEDYRYLTRLAPNKMYVSEYAHGLWENGYAESDQDARNMILDVLQSASTPARAAEELNRRYNEERIAEEYYRGMQEAAEHEERQRREKEAEENEIQRQIIEENDLSLLNEAEKAGISQSEIDKVFTATALIDLIEEKRYENRRQTGNAGTDFGKTEISESERNLVETTGGETGIGDRSGQDMVNPGGHENSGGRISRPEDNRPGRYSETGRASGHHQPEIHDKNGYEEGKVQQAARDAGNGNRPGENQGDRNADGRAGNTSAASGISSGRDLAQTEIATAREADSKYGKNILPDTTEAGENLLSLQNEIISEKGEINYDRLREAADAVESGKVHIDRLSLGEEQGREKGDRRNVEASILLGSENLLGRAASENGGTAQERGGSPGAKNENDARKRQEQLLTDWAKHEGIFETYEDATSRKLYDSTGTESKVYEGESPDTVIKITFPYQFSNNPLEFLDNRISLHNHLFPETAYKLLGITQKGKSIGFIMEQPYIDAEMQHMDFSNPELMEKYRTELERRGFKTDDKDHTTIYNDDYIVDDLHEDNILIDKDGNFYFIDTVPSLNTSEDGFGGTREYGDYSLAKPKGIDKLKEDAYLPEIKDKHFVSEPIRTRYDFDVKGITEANAREMQAVKERAQADGTFMKAPNGKDTKLNERQWLQVRTKPFIDWFGDWINDPANASKAVDENGEPMVVYHGTGENFTEFRKDKLGSRENMFFFTPSKEAARDYGASLMPVFLNVREFGKDGKLIDDTEAGISDTSKEASVEIAVSSPDQIKSATANNGNFENENPNILFDSAPIRTQVEWDFKGDAKSTMPEGEGLPKGEDSDGETFMERLLTEQKQITFAGESLTGKAKITSAKDVAFLFRNLESAASENAFAVFHGKGGSYKVLYLGTGTSSSVNVEIPLIAAAARELGAESLTFVHNHPSGNLTPSKEDVNMHRNLGTSLEIPVNDSVIINLDSGKFGTFSEYGSDTETTTKGESPETKAKVYQFDRQKLYREENGRPVKINTSQDVAEFLSRQKRGTVPKIQVIVTSNANEITRYAFVDPNLTTGEISKEIITLVGKHGNRVILSSNGLISADEVLSVKKRLGRAGVTLMDNLVVRQTGDVIDNYTSFLDEGILKDAGALPGNPTPPDVLRADLNKKLDKALEKIAEAHFDRWHPVKVFLDALRKEGTKIDDHNDFHLQASAVTSMIKAWNDRFASNQMKPLLKSVADIEKKGFSLRDVENYAMLKFGTLERNPYYEPKRHCRGKEAEKRLFGSGSHRKRNRQTGGAIHQ